MKQQMTEWRPLEMAGAQTFEIRSERTGETYRILLRIPSAPAPETGHPVLWMLDGDASFPLTFCRPAHRLQPRPASAGVIVAVSFPGAAPYDPAARARNYTPQPDAETGDHISREFGGASDFLHFLAGELRPLLAGRLPLDPARQTLFGHSYGGLFTLHALLGHPGHFQRYWAASPSLWFSEALLLRRMRAEPPVATGERLVITVGRDEQYCSQPLSAGRRARLDRRTMVDNITEAARRIADANPGLATELIVASDHDHFDMLPHGVRRVQAMAFDEPESDL